MAVHGSCTRYNAGCRCGLCREANTSASRERRERLKAEAPARVLVGGHWVSPPQRTRALTPLGERAAEASAKAAAVRGASETAQKRRDGYESEALAADLLDHRDRLRPGAGRPARRPAAGSTSAYEKYHIATLPPVASWQADGWPPLGLWRTLGLMFGYYRSSERDAWGAAREPRRQPPAPAPAPARAAPVVERRGSAEQWELYAEDTRRWISGQSSKAPRMPER